MNSTALQLVTFEQAVKLDQLGFKYPTRERYNYADEGRHITESATPRNHNDRFCWVNKKKEGCSAPTVALALKWMRDVKGFQCGVYPAEWGRPGDGLTRYFGCWFDLDCDKIDGTIGFGTYEAAESALLDELLNLI